MINESIQVRITLSASEKLHKTLLFLFLKCRKLLAHNLLGAKLPAESVKVAGCNQKNHQLRGCRSIHFQIWTSKSHMQNGRQKLAVDRSNAKYQEVQMFSAQKN